MKRRDFLKAAVATIALNPVARALAPAEPVDITVNLGDYVMKRWRQEFPDELTHFDQDMFGYRFIYPANGVWDLQRGKVWHATRDTPRIEWITKRDAYIDPTETISPARAHLEK